MEAIKYDSGKYRVDMVPPEYIEGLANIFEMGAKKYGENNWKNGLDINRFYAAALRHLFAFKKGQIKDDESGYDHMLHAAWNCLAIYWYTGGKKDV